MSGVSVGAINGSFLALHPPGEERKAIEELENLYMNYLPQDYFDFWPWKIIEPTFTKKSFLDNSGMLRIMDELLSDRPF